MSNDDNASQWGASAGEPDRGPSFEDPSQPTSPALQAPASGQDWDRAWGMGDEAQPGPGMPPAGENFGQNPPPMQGNGYGPGAQPHPYGGAPGAQGVPYAGGAPGQYGGQAPQGQNPYPAQYGPQDPYAAQSGGYQQQPYGAYGAYNYPQPVKSKTSAALLAFFLGGLGIHDFYLGKKNLGFIHLGLAIGGLVLMLIGGIAASASGDPESPLFALIGLGYLVIVGNGIWAFVEFIMILVKPENELGR